MRFFSLLAIPFCLFGSFEKEMSSDFDVIRYNTSFRYALKDWKESYLGWDLDGAYERGKNKISFCQTSKDYQVVVKDFFNELRDYHVKSYFYSTEISFLPLRARCAENRYFLSLNLDIQINTAQDEIPFLLTAMNENMMTFEHIAETIEDGDELLKVDGKGIRKVIEEVINNELGGDLSSTGFAIAERMLFLRRGKYAQNCPKGCLSLTIKKKRTGKVVTVKLPWIHVEESVTNRSCALKEESVTKEYAAPFVRDFITSYNTPEDLRRKGFLPPLGEILLETSRDDQTGIYAYLYRHPKTGKKVGYICIPTFTLADDAVVKPWMTQFLGIINCFEEEAEALVVDITNNPGGNGMFCYAVLSALTDKPLKPLFQRETVSQQEVYKASIQLKTSELFPIEETFSDEVFGFPVTLKTIESIRSYSKNLVDAWQKGDSLTDPLPLMGIDEIPPHPRGRFTKPLLVLTNELCFSCGDLFPALLQDNGRAKIFGKRTAGAGGYVRTFEHTSQFGIQGYTLTGSIIYRDNGEVLENGGVKPDIAYEITVDDLNNGFKGYIKSVNKALFN